MAASVPERCPFCNSGDRREETWRGSPAYSFSCGTVFYADGEVAWRYFTCYAREKEREERAIREQLAAARAEAERWKRRHDALRERVADVVGLIDAAEHEAYLASLVDYNQYHAGREDAFERMGEWLREVLTETGGNNDE